MWFLNAVKFPSCWAFGFRSKGSLEQCWNQSSRRILQHDCSEQSACPGPATLIKLKTLCFEQTIVSSPLTAAKGPVYQLPQTLRAIQKSLKPTMSILRSPEPRPPQRANPDQPTVGTSLKVGTRLESSRRPRTPGHPAQSCWAANG